MRIQIATLEKSSQFEQVQDSLGAEGGIILYIPGRDDDAWVGTKRMNDNVVFWDSLRLPEDLEKIRRILNAD